MTDEEHRAQKAKWQRKYRATHPEEEKRYRATHKTKCAAGQKRYRVAHPELMAKRAAEQKRYREAHPELKVMRTMHPEKSAAYRASHKEKIAAYQKVYRVGYNAAHSGKEYRVAHPGKKRVLSEKEKEAKRVFLRAWQKRNRLKKNLVDARRRAESMVNTLVGELLTEAQWHEILDRYGFRCAYCGRKLEYGVPGSVPTMDHVIPLSKGGGHSKGNIVPACGRCNSAKRDKTLEQWTGLRI